MTPDGDTTRCQGRTVSSHSWRLEPHLHGTNPRDLRALGRAWSFVCHCKKNSGGCAASGGRRRSTGADGERVIGSRDGWVRRRGPRPAAHEAEDCGHPVDRDRRKGEGAGLVRWSPAGAGPVMCPRQIPQGHSFPPLSNSDLNNAGCYHHLVGLAPVPFARKPPPLALFRSLAVISNVTPAFHHHQSQNSEHHHPWVKSLQ